MDNDDLQAAVSVTASAPSGSEAAQLNQDASAYLYDQEPFLSPGWQTEADAIRQELYALTVSCGIKPGFAAHVSWN